MTKQDEYRERLLKEKPATTKGGMQYRVSKDGYNVVTLRNGVESGHYVAADFPQLFGWNKEPVQPTEPKRYVIDKITDIFDIPEDRFADFLVDFKSYYQMGRPFADLIKELAKVGNIDVEVVPLKMTWIDDGEHNVTVNIGASAKK